MSGRELVILLLGLAIVAVVLRGLYVAINARRGQIRLAIDKNIPQNVDLDALEMAELPGGGARVVTRSLEEVNRQNSALDKAETKARAIHLADDEDGDHIPVLMDAVEVSEPKTARKERAQPQPKASEEPEDAPVDEEWTSAAQDDELDGQAESDAALVQTPSIGEDWDEEPEQAIAEADEPDMDEEDADAILFDYEEDDSDQDDWEDETPRSTIDTMSSVAPDYDDDSSDADDDLAEIPDDDGYDEIAEDIESNFDEADEQDEAEDDYAPFDADSRVDEFSMTAGERIGGDRPQKTSLKAKPKPKPKQKTSDRQSSLFDEPDAEDDDAESKQGRSLFTLFGRKSKRSHSHDDAAERDAFEAEELGAAEEQNAPIEQHAFVEDDEPVDLPEDVLDDDYATSEADSVEAEAKDSGFEHSEVLVLNVTAKDGRVFSGDDLLHILITSGLKFGDMNIFHKRLSKDNQGAVVFSVANMLNPGTFDLNNMDEFTTLGISFFLALPTPINNLDAFEQMLGVAQRIRDTLGGDLKDDHRNGMTAQTIEHYRQRIRDFELRRLKAKATRA